MVVLIVVGSLLVAVTAYRTYGRFLARRVFVVDPDRVCPSVEREDGVDFVPSRRSLVFGHHFTSIAGTGPIVGPAIAVFWGWLPALLWVLVGSVFIGAVHDFGALVISMRHRGRTIADLSGDVVSARVRLLFIAVCVVGLWIVLAVFGLVIATIFSLYPSSVIPVWSQIPIAVAFGVWIRRGGSVALGAMVSVALMYLVIVLSARIDWAANPILPSAMTEVLSPVVFWTLVLMGYVYVASVLPVQVLLQPRDSINAWQLLIAMGLLVAGLLVARPELAAPAVRSIPEGSDVPAMMPFLFITVACGAVSGFHCLVSSGCSSRQLRTESDAQAVGYGAMLTEGFLAVLVILACVAGFAMGAPDGRGVFESAYSQWGSGSGLGAILRPFVEGAANVMGSVGVPTEVGAAIMGVFIASFAATTLDSATRLQRFLLHEVSAPRDERAAPAWRRVVSGRWVTTGVAVMTALALALSDLPSKGWSGAGLGGLTLWPVFGATNQLLASLALLVVSVWLVRQRRPVWVSAAPMGAMLVITGYAIVLLTKRFFDEGATMLFVIALLMGLMQVWIVVECVVVALRARRGSPS